MRALRARGDRRGLRLRRLAAQDGNALVEFVVLALVMLIPSLYLVLTLGRVQAAVFAADVLARDVARIHATEPDVDRARTRSAQMSALVLSDHGLAGDPAQVISVRCSHTPCATPGGTVSVHVSIPVSIPGIGPLLGGQALARVGADHQAQVDQYRDLTADTARPGETDGAPGAPTPGPSADAPAPDGAPPSAPVTDPSAPAAPSPSARPVQPSAAPTEGSPGRRPGRTVPPPSDPSDRPR